LPFHFAVASAEFANRRATSVAALLSAVALADRAQGHVHGLLHEVGARGRFYQE